MSTVEIKLFAGQGTGWTDGQTEEAATRSFPFVDHKKQNLFEVGYCLFPAAGNCSLIDLHH